MCPVTEPTATVEGRRVLEELAAPVRAAVLVAVDGRAVAVIALADVPLHRRRPSRGHHYENDHVHTRRESHGERTCPIATGTPVHIRSATLTTLPLGLSSLTRQSFCEPSSFAHNRGACPD